MDCIKSVVARVLLASAEEHRLEQQRIVHGEEKNNTCSEQQPCHGDGEEKNDAALVLLVTPFVKTGMQNQEVFLSTLCNFVHIT